MAQHEGEKTRPVNFRLTQEKYEQLRLAAQQRGRSPGLLARDWVLAALAAAATDEPSKPVLLREGSNRDDLERLLGKAVWAIIIALSPDLNEVTAEEFVREFFYE